MANKLTIQVSVVYSPAARDVREVNLNLPASTTVLQALKLSGLLQLFPLIDTLSTVVGVWGRQVEWDHMLRDHDRVEIYRALTVDPKVARRERFVKQGTKGAGLFAKKRPGAAAGY
jgi:putative ubiquitin-RnfH superfamily antitoxin RatB of RatAB toxin-antitoxin module